MNKIMFRSYLFVATITLQKGGKDSPFLHRDKAPTNRPPAFASSNITFDTADVYQSELPYKSGSSSTCGRLCSLQSPYETTPATPQRQAQPQSGFVHRV